MDAAVADGVLRVQVRGIDAGAPGVKGILHHPHAGIAADVLQGLNTFIEAAKIVRDELHPGQTTADGADEIFTGALHPAALLGDTFLHRNGPEPDKSVEMVQPDHVIQPSGSLQAADPPVVAVGFQIVPVVQGVAPGLTLFIDGVRGRTCHQLGAAA